MSLENLKSKATTVLNRVE